MKSKIWKSRIEKIMERLYKEGKVKDVTIEFSDEFYKKLEKIADDSKNKQRKSFESVRNIILD